MTEHEHDHEHEHGTSDPADGSEAPPEDLGLETTEAAHLQAEEQAFVAETSEGAQELAPRGTTTAPASSARRWARSCACPRAATSTRATSTSSAATTRR